MMENEILIEQLKSIKRAALVLAKMNQHIVEKLVDVQALLEQTEPDVAGGLDVIKTLIDA